MTAKRKAAAVALMALVLAGCASTSPEERARAASVRIVKDADAVRGCHPIGSVTDDDMEDLQKKAARMGGDVALVTLQSQRGGGSGPALRYGSSTYTTAEVYRCGGSGR
jgi:starvation-inducible outer membrane lipoprotein